jgi:hypothetical protein
MLVNVVDTLPFAYQSETSSKKKEEMKGLKDFHFILLLLTDIRSPSVNVGDTYIDLVPMSI